MAEVTQQELVKFDELQESLTSEFIQDVSKWADWDAMSGFEERMARMAVRKLIRKAYHAGSMEGIESMVKYMHSDEVFGNDPTSKV